MPESEFDFTEQLNATKEKEIIPELTEAEEKRAATTLIPRKKSVSKGPIEMTFHGDAIEQNDAVEKRDTRTKVVGIKQEPVHFVIDDGGEKSIVWLAMELKCTIGNERFHFKKNEKYRVSNHVKDVLVNRGALKAL
jgi:hypothetical protein